MTVQFSFTRSEDGTETIVVMGSQGVRVVPDSHANYDRIKADLIGGSASATEAEVYALTDAAMMVADTLSRLSEQVTLKGDTLYFDGDEVDSRLSRHIVDMVKGGDDNYGGYVKFLENLKANPSGKSKRGLFKFLENNELLITQDGCFIGYKAVGTDGKSISAGHEDVTVTYADGTVETHKGNVPYPVGAAVEMPRSLVDADPDSACSVGLHVGTHDYANTFSTSGKFLTVKVSPRDVVSVPKDSNGEKLRACRFTILEENEGRTRYEGTSYLGNPGDSVDDDDNDPEDDWSFDYAWDDGEDVTFVIGMGSPAAALGVRTE